MGHLLSSSSSPPFLSGWQKKRGRPLCGGGMLFWAAGPAGPILAPGLCGTQWTGPPLGGTLALWIIADLGSFLRDHDAPGLQACTCASSGAPENAGLVVKLHWCHLYTSSTRKAHDVNNFPESNEVLMKLGPKLPDERRVTLSRRSLGKL